MTTLSSASNNQADHHAPSDTINDAYGEGFVDGRASMAETIAKQLLDRMDDEDISQLTGLTVGAIETLRDPIEGHAAPPITAMAETTVVNDAPFRLIRETPTPDTAFVEPNFVRLIREVKQLTQAELAQQLDVHERTVCAWETAETPVRLRTATYDKLVILSRAQAQTEQT